MYLLGLRENIEFSTTVYGNYRPKFKNTQRNTFKERERKSEKHKVINIRKSLVKKNYK